MKPHTKEVVETLTLASLLNIGSWELQTVSLVGSICLTFVSIVWVLLQISKFAVSWWREQITARRGSGKSDSPPGP